MAYKLTLNITDKEILDDAKKYSKKKKTSLSKIVESQLRQLVRSHKEKNKSVVDALIGSAEGAIKNGEDYKEALSKMVKHKHGIK